LNDVKLVPDHKFEEDLTLPVRKLDFTNLPIGTPPQMSHRGARTDHYN